MRIPERTGFVQSVCLALLAICLAACGGGGVDSAFDGTWSGTASLTSAGVPSATTTATFTLRVENGELLVPGCNGPIRVPGDGRRAHWTGQAVCPAPTASCPSATITTLDFEATLLSDNHLQTKGVSRGDGCGVTAQILGSFDGVRQ